MLLKRVLLIAAIAVAAVMAEDEEDTKTKISGWGYLTFGYVGSGYDQTSTTTTSGEFDIDFSQEWLSDYQAGLKIERSFSEELRAYIHLGVTTAYIVENPRLQSYEMWIKKWAVYLVDAAIERTVPIGDMLKLKFEFGQFPVRYNPEARNLGEYLFRSTPYPTVIESGFELADKEKLAGLHWGLNANLLEESNLKFDTYLSTAMRHMPIFDISLSGVLAFNYEKLFEVGAGIMFQNLISIDKGKTTPGKDPEKMSMYPERFVYVNPLTGEQTNFTFRGTKVMGRLTLNPNQLIKSEMLGPEDLKLYGELAILGLKNYYPWYNDISQRIPWMIGFNIPGFKVIDVVSLQLQHHKNPYWNSWEAMWRLGTAIPYQGLLSPLSYEQWLADSNACRPITEDDWKWSLYLSKNAGKYLRLSLQFANDNMFKTKYMPGPPQQAKYTEIMRTTWAKNSEGKEIWGKIRDWYWMARITFYL